MFQKIAQQGPTGSVEAPTVKFSTNSSPLIMPAVTNENMRSEDLLEIKLTAMKQVDETFIKGYLGKWKNRDIFKDIRSYIYMKITTCA